ncbi:DUF4262 domain-containing protein [Xanthomonas euroxanthea]|uniref:DUF4262 domain-containing protein n=1 Tax=Xanthomonas euroxanthea TaxID=2259622 RepID=UPI001AF38F7E|nr:DUF4262 domain-containing protein [Xanthomonas euroxanthea]CAG2082493.1 DUF4262 domain-containing protein [Xanthomonas euroxanthea]
MVSSIGVDESERQLLDDVAEYGWHCIHIMEEGEQVGYSFTVGLYQTFGHPELIIFGLSSRVSHQILSIVADAARAGTPLHLSHPTDALINHYSCCFAEVPLSEYYEHVGFARWYYQGDDFPLYQIVWPSKSGLFPWHPRASAEFRAAQPVFGQTASGN